MNILRKVIGAITGRKSLNLSAVTGSGAAGDAGEIVTPQSSMALSAVWACSNLIAGSISSLPLQVYRELPDGFRETAKDHPLYRVLHDAPNYDQTALDYWEYMSQSVELWGNAYARLDRSGGVVSAMTPIKPDAITVRRLPNGSLEYRWSQDSKSYTGTDRDVLHIRGPGGDPLGGMSTLQFGRNTFSAAMAAERAASGMFRNGLRPSGVMKFKEWLTAEQRELAEGRMVEKYLGAVNAGRPMVLEGGVDYQHLSISPEDAQMLETRGFSVEEVCRFFGVPPVMIGHPGGSTAWPTSVEQQVLVFMKFTLRRRLKRIEQAIMRQMLTPEDRAAGITIEFNVEGLLRGDSAARAAFYASALQNGWATINEVRRKENMPSVPGGDEPRMQMQNQPITEAGNDNPNQ